MLSSIIYLVFDKVINKFLDAIAIWAHVAV